MAPQVQVLLDEWSPPLIVDALMFLASAFYLRGWLSLKRSSPGFFSVSRMSAFFAGIFFLWIAIASPLAAFDDASLTVHMVQHILLMLVVPPLLLLGAPALPFLHGFPAFLVRSLVGPLLRSSLVQSVGRFLSHPLTCWLLAAVALLAWHVPSAFELALRSDFWHDLEHTCFFSTSLLFWWPVIQPFPSHPVWPRWSIPAYLFVGMFPSAALGAFLVFCDRIAYPSYAHAPVLLASTPLADQILAGALMWVLDMFVCLVPAVLISIKLLSPPVAPLNTMYPTPHRVSGKQLSSASASSRL